MKVLISATYFEPYHSGLSTYAYRLAKGLTQRGHEVVVLTSAYASALKLEEWKDDIHIVRVPVSFRLSKGVVMLGLSKAAWQWIGWADVVNLHLPQFESFYLARLVKCSRKPLVVTWHCDLEMSGGVFGQFAGWVTNHLGRVAARLSNRIVQNSMDYARTSRHIRQFIDKVEEVCTPIEVEAAQSEIVEDLRQRIDFKPGQKIIGLAGRVAREKGYEYLVEALPGILAEFPTARVVHAGMWAGVVGEQDYQAEIEKLIALFGERWVSLGFLSDAAFRAFFAMIDVLAFSSLNRTESFGIVQIEAMAQGTPIAASDLPGVRQPVLRTGMGEIVPLRDARALAGAIKKVLTMGKPAEKPEAYLASFGVDAVAKRYEEIYAEVLGNAAAD